MWLVESNPSVHIWRYMFVQLNQFFNAMIQLYLCLFWNAFFLTAWSELGTAMSYSFVIPTIFRFGENWVNIPDMWHRSIVVGTDGVGDKVQVSNHYWYVLALRVVKPNITRYDSYRHSYTFPTTISSTIHNQERSGNLSFLSRVVTLLPQPDRAAGRYFGRRGYVIFSVKLTLRRYLRFIGAKPH